MHRVLRGVPLLAVLLLVVVVLAFAGSMVRAQTSWAVEAGTAICTDMSYCSSYPACSSSSPGSYYRTAAGSPPFASNATRQLAALAIRVTGENVTFQVETVKLIFSLQSSDSFNFTLALFFFEANMTNASFPTPGAVLPGWEGGRVVAFQKESDTPVSPVGVEAPYFRMSAAITPFNLSAGTYFVSVATYGTKQPLNYAYKLAVSPTDGAYYPVYLGIESTNAAFPGFLQNATHEWSILGVTTDVVPCLWPTGTTFRPQGSNTTTTTGGNSTTTTGGNSTTTTGGNSTTTGGNSTTTGGSGGDNPTDYLVRFALTTELNGLSPAGFVSGVSDALELPSDAPIVLVAARRAQVTTDGGKRATETGTLVDFYISGSEGASLMDKALSAKLSTLRGYNVSIASAPSQIYPDASSGSLLRPSAYLLLQAAALSLLGC